MQQQIYEKLHLDFSITLTVTLFGVNLDNFFFLFISYFSLFHYSVW